MPIPPQVRALVDASVDATSVVDPELRLLYFNASYAKLAGLRPRALRREARQGMCHTHFGMESCDEGCVAHRAIRMGRACRVDEVVARVNDRTLIVVATPIYEGDTLIGVVEQYRDVTAESRLQREYRRLLDEAHAEKRRIAEQSAAELARQNAELQRMNQALVRADSAKSRFVASMSHEIRTPLSGVLGMARLLEETPLTDVQRHFVRTICESGDTLLALISNVLDFTKIESGHMELERAPFSLREIVESAAHIFAPAAEAKGVGLVVLISPSLDDTFIGDASRLRQILVNLCNNAVKFTLEGRVVVQVGPDPEAPGHVRFSVTDTGIGVPEDRQHKLFDPFTQADETTTREFGGTGLGLTITKQLADLMQGTLGLVSEVGVGSTFWLSVPLEAPRQARSARGKTRGRRAYIVESEALRAKSLLDALTWLDVRATVHCRLDELDLEGVTAPLVFVRHPVAPDQADVFDALKSRADVRVVAMAGVSRYAELAREEGLDGLLAQPIKPSQVAQLLRLLERDERRTSGRAASRALPREERRILVVEDSRVNREILTRVLRKAGYVVEEAVNGAEGVSAVLGGDFDLVLMHCQMPVLDGFEATRQIRESQTRHVPILAMTANVTPEDRERCTEAGMDGYMTKPFRPRSLLERLDGVLFDSERA
jgi:signal transduction histidine kinase/CheY-like chemotaxis protein